MLNKIKIFKEIINDIRNTNHELLYAKIWDDTSRDIDWVKNMPGISPGRWAVGYNYLYVMTRVLNEMKPKKVLEMGLGISTSLISSYFKSVGTGKDFEHTVIEQDGQWRDFYLSAHDVADYTKIHVVETTQKTWKGVEYEAYDDISHIVQGKKYSVISIDAPKGSEIYSRRDIIEYLPEILEPDFVIIVDDCNRLGEKNTAAEIEAVLRDHGIPVCSGLYVGSTYCTIITSASYRFFCSM